MLRLQELSSLAFIYFYFRRGCSHCLLVARGFALFGAVAIGI
jgi:hypothetical protein